jgi:hypothetical protein
MALRGLFNRKQNEGVSPGSRTMLVGPRYPRHSSGWSALLKHLKAEQGLRVLDIGPTSPTNINFLTGMGHSVYMADVVHEALDNDWSLPPAEEGAAPGFDLERFFEHNLNFGDRRFDVILLWSTLDYIPEHLIVPLVNRLHESVVPGGKVLALFHTKASGPETIYCRYHLVDGEDIEMQESAPHPVLRAHTNRRIETLFSAYSNYKFYLAKDNVNEVIITR